MPFQKREWRPRSTIFMYPSSARTSSDHCHHLPSKYTCQARPRPSLGASPPGDGPASGSPTTGAGPPAPTSLAGSSPSPPTPMTLVSRSTVGISPSSASAASMWRWRSASSTIISAARRSMDGPEASSSSPSSVVSVAAGATGAWARAASSNMVRSRKEHRFEHGRNMA